jgi:hypothetical protein
MIITFTYHHGTYDKGVATSPKGGNSFFSGNSDGGIGDTFVVAAFFDGKRDIVGHTDDGDFHGTGKVSGNSTSKSTDPNSFGRRKERKNGNKCEKSATQSILFFFFSSLSSKLQCGVNVLSTL